MTGKPKPMKPTRSPKAVGKSNKVQPTAAERLAALLANARSHGAQPLTAADFARWQEQGCAIWPDEAELAAFDDWVRRCRQLGAYD
ncbi:MAG: hypothetical protein JNM56_00115 [Planctomycetia bacterium]|nr:hypothetical protein [Planctomycetia bacterium]